MPHNIFVLGLDDRNQAELDALPDAEQYVFHSLLTIEEMQESRVSFSKILKKLKTGLSSSRSP